MCLVYHNISIESRKIRVEWLRLSFGKKNFFAIKKLGYTKSSFWQEKSYIIIRNYGMFIY